MRNCRLGCVAASLITVWLATGCTSPPYQAARAPALGAQVPPEVEYARGTFTGAGGVELFEQSWRPSEKTRAILVFVHGLKDHSSRYRDLGIQLAHRGIAVHSFDLRGHGYSAGVRDHIDSLDDAVADLGTVITRAREKHPHLPLFVAGQGLGAGIAAVWNLRNQAAPAPAKPATKLAAAGLILSAPVLYGEVKRGERLGTRAAATFTPTSDGLELDLADWSSDPAVVAALKEDPLVYDGQPTSATARELLRASDELATGAAQLETPVILLFGASDKVADVERGRALHDAIASKDKRIEVFEGMKHDVFHERERNQVVTALLGWVNAHAVPAALPAPEPVSELAAQETPEKPERPARKRKRR